MMQDGLGADHSSDDRATEDFITVNGNAFKMDQTEFKFDSWKLGKQPETMKTLVKKFPKHHCDLTFTPQSSAKAGFNAVFLAFKQFVQYGYFSGSCTVGEKTYELDNVWGFCEHVHTRW